MERLLSDSLGFVKAVGIVPRDSDLDAFANRFLAMKAIREKMTKFSLICVFCFFYHILSQFLESVSKNKS